MRVKRKGTLLLHRNCSGHHNTGLSMVFILFSLDTGFDEDSVFIVSGKEFALVRTSGNKVKILHSLKVERPVGQV